ncbi:hypothetical protein JAAARDRAFT_534780 [Jaapia argillacea MUCL 33604]|uniref:Uncharacterized protein n=1 Tax=Jaapia argillacea MUCL 33604 TaxID=933084 RepID=A0A067PBI6_9AGAM|nr:hypothetical protein JAAARDRAFT_534780 [Jaapia argillacea MUCL 33604]
MTSGTRNAIIIGATIAGVIVLSLFTGLFIFYKRHQYKKLFFFNRNQPKRRSQLLAGEDMDDEPPMRYTDYAGSGKSNDSSPSLMRHRADTGSIFHEGVWPPPGAPSRFVDPLLSGSSRVELTGIVDGVMGPSADGSPSRIRGGARDSFPSILRDSRATSMYSQESTGSREDAQTPPSPIYSPPSREHTRDSSATSQTALLSSYHRPSVPSPLSTLNLDSNTLPPPLGQSHERNSSTASLTSQTPVRRPNWLERSPKRMSFGLNTESPDSSSSAPGGLGSNR